MQNKDHRVLHPYSNAQSNFVVYIKILRGKSNLSEDNVAANCTDAVLCQLYSSVFIWGNVCTPEFHTTSFDLIISVCALSSSPLFILSCLSFLHPWRSLLLNAIMEIH